jgi:Lar family restriction alleviation protein
MASEDATRRPVIDEAGMELLACPFCASTNVRFFEHVYAQQFAVTCNLCGAEGPRRTSYEEAGRLWNRRVRA